MIYPTGDIHGCLGSLISLVDQIRADDPDFIILGCGDYIDRGPDSKGVVEYIIQLQKEGRFVGCCGNHDVVWNYLINGKKLYGHMEAAEGPDGDFNTLQWFMGQGLRETIISYGVDLKDWYIKSKALIEEIRAKVPESHKSFFAQLELFVHIDSLFVCHANFPTDLPLPQSSDIISDDLAENMLWERYGHNQVLQGFKDNWGECKVYCGHTPTNYYNSLSPMSIISQGKLNLLDCGSFIGNGIGRISSKCHETNKEYYSKD